MKKRIYSILMVVVMTMALVACGSQSTNVSAPEATETVNEAVETTDTENSEAVSTPETSTEVVDPESGEAVSEPETSTEVLPDSEAVESEATSESESDEVASTPDSEAVVEPEFTFTEVSKTLYAVQSVNVRSGPSTDYDKIGGLTTNQEVQVISRCNETGWYKFIWADGSEAYVSNKYLADEKVEVQKPAASETPSNGGSTGGQASSGQKNWQDDYQSYTWYDMNDFMFIIVNTREEAINTLDYSGARATLEARFPGNQINSGAASPLRDGHYMCFAYKVGIFVDSFVAPYK